MTQRSFHLIILAAAVYLLPGCKKYLTVQPEDRLTESQVYTNEKSIQQALNGLYGTMAQNGLYGASLTNKTVDLLGQRYNTVNAGSSNNYQQIQTFNYTQESVMNTFDSLWQNGYAAILGTNKFIAEMDGAVQRGVITKDHGDLMKGEALGIRAMLHFDLLRLFGPVYLTSPDAPAIPYYKLADGKTRAIIPARAVLDSVLADLSAAETLLEKDPVITGGIKATTDFYTGYRNQRLNYYAIKTLIARAQLYGGNKAAANAAAKAALEGGEKWFPWVMRTAVADATSPDRIFLPEVLFAVYNQDMYNNFNGLFSVNVRPTEILNALPARLDNIYESNANDYRNQFIWPMDKGRCFYKFADAVDPVKPWRFLQPLVRKTELYYILAETGTDATTQRGYLDSVRAHRGLPALPTTAVIATEVTKEYQKEFFGEGQVYFYFKRLNQKPIPSGTSGTGTITPNYIIPLPLSETTPR